MADPMCAPRGSLLDERVPRRYVPRTPQPDVAGSIARERRRATQIVPCANSTTAHTPEPHVGLLGDLPYCVLLTNAGSGYSRANGIAVTRWRADATRDDTGQWIYVKDLTTARVWSAAHQPMRAPRPTRIARRSPPTASFSARRDGDIETRTDIIVVPRRARRGAARDA